MMMRGLGSKCRDSNSDSRAVVCETLSGCYIREMLTGESRGKAVNAMTRMRQSFQSVSARLGCFSFALRGPL